MDDDSLGNEGPMAGMTFLLVIPNDSALRVSGWLFEALELEFKRGWWGGLRPRHDVSFQDRYSPDPKTDLFLVDAATAIKAEHLEGI